MLRATFRERRGVVTLLAMPPVVGFAMMDYFARPRPHKNKEPIYKEGHTTWRQGTLKGGAYHFMEFSYDEQDHTEWAFNLGDFYHKTCADATRVVTNGRLSDLRVWANPVQFKYKWTAQSKLGESTFGANTLTIKANITHIPLTEGAPPRFNMEYGRWVAELQQEHIVAAKKAVLKFPVRPFRRSHKLYAVKHPLLEWAAKPTPLPAVVDAQAFYDAATAGDDSDGAFYDDYDGDDSGEHSADNDSGGSQSS